MSYKQGKSLPDRPLQEHQHHSSPASGTARPIINLAVDMRTIRHVLASNACSKIENMFGMTQFQAFARVQDGSPSWPGTGLYGGGVLGNSGLFWAVRQRDEARAPHARSNSRVRPKAAINKAIF